MKLYNNPIIGTNRLLPGILMPVLILIASCDENNLFVTREQFQETQERNRKLEVSVDSLQRRFNEQAGELSSIISDIADLSNRTARIKLDGSEKPLSDYETAKSDIRALRERLDHLEEELEKSKAKNAELSVSAGAIAKLRQALNAKEKEIIRLQMEIKEKDRTIKQREETISVQKDTILRQMNELLKKEKELRRLVDGQIELLYKAGIRFSEIADEGDFKVTGRKNKLNVRQYRAEIYREAYDLYEAAARQGHQAARDSMAVTKTKINQLYKTK